MSQWERHMVLVELQLKKETISQLNPLAKYCLEVVQKLRMNDIKTKTLVSKDLIINSTMIILKNIPKIMSFLDQLLGTFRDKELTWHLKKVVHHYQ